MVTSSPGCTLVFYVRKGRAKAVDAAKLEAVALLTGFEAKVLFGGPLSQQGGVFCMEVAASEADLHQVDLDRLGYTVAVDRAVEIPESHFRENRDDMTRFKGKALRLERLFESDPEAVRERDPDQRPFHLATPEGGVRAVRGYRGNGSQFGRRALPVCDAQLLVNLVAPAKEKKTLLDPFAGAGGIVQEALRADLTVFSVDIDPILSPGLSRMGARHHVGSATQLPYDAESMDAIATEPPFAEGTEDLLRSALHEMWRVLKVGGRIAIYGAEWQAETLRAVTKDLPLQPLLDLKIDRKGYPCHLLAWERRPASAGDAR